MATDTMRQARKSEYDLCYKLGLQHLKTLIELWPKLIRVKSDGLTWGDEVCLSCRNEELLKVLNKSHPGCFQPEAYKFMLESNPKHPFIAQLEHLVLVEDNMRYRRGAIKSLLNSHEEVLTLTNIPLDRDSGYDGMISQRSRYREILHGIVDHAGSSYGFRIGNPPMFLNDIVFGLGVCGLQVTFSAADFQDACYTHDQLVPLGPLMLALSAATPTINRRTVDSDTRWAIQSALTDDRNAQERGSTIEIPPRISSSTQYLQNQAMNDKRIKFPGEFTLPLIKAGFTQPVAEYFAHVLSRRPLLKTQDEGAEEALRKYLTTYYPHVRLKIPENAIPWRLEFRPMESQPTDFENAALAVVMVLIRQVILPSINIQIPISKMEENMRRANQKNAVLEQRFWFMAGEHFEGEATLNDIFNGVENWPGFIPLLEIWLEGRSKESNMSIAATEKIRQYLWFISARASGHASTPAKWIRSFVEREGGELDPQTYYKMLIALRDRDVWS